MTDEDFATIRLLAKAAMPRPRSAANAIPRSAENPQDITALLDEIERLRGLLKWRPIDDMTPPNEIVELYSPPTEFAPAVIEVGYAIQGSRIGAYSSISRHGSATHWRPIVGPEDLP